jgi:glycosyltransferase involved in cell wall biosynthesis
MPATPLVSIITPSFNQAAFLEDTLRSVLSQTYAPIQYLVIDGGSEDGSQAIIQRYASRLAYWESTPDRGQAHAINKGLQRATGDILGWLNSDDVLLPNTVQRVVETFAAHPEIDVVYGRLDRIDPGGAPVPTPRLPKDNLTFGPETVIGECIVNQPGSFWRRGMMARAGLLDESLRYNLDYEYWMRIALLGGRFYHLDEVVAHFRLSPSSKTVGQTAAMAVEQWSVLESLLRTPHLHNLLGLTPAQVARRARYARAIIALHAAYGYFKLRRFTAALAWLFRALANDPSTLLDPRWRALLIARQNRARGN